MPYISVRNWRKFQHYDPAIRVPPWIKTHTELMADDAYLGLSEHRALMLHRLWLEYASSRCRLRVDVSSRPLRGRFETASLGRRLNMRVTSSDIEGLCEAGFIDIVASAELADGYQAASVSRAREEVEVDVDIPLPPSRTTPKPAARNGRAGARDKKAVDLAEKAIRHGAYLMTDASLLEELDERHVPEPDRPALLELAQSLRPNGNGDDIV